MDNLCWRRLSSGPEVDLLGAVSATPQGGGGAYSPYIGVVVDMMKVMDSLHTAQYQYIPALALPQNEQLNLKLNNPPSFHNPKSVLVVALPPVEPAALPILSPVEPKQVYCAQNPSLALAADGAPLVFATEVAHGFTSPCSEQGRQERELSRKARSVTRRIRGGWEHSQLGGSRPGGERYSARKLGI